MNSDAELARQLQAEEDAAETALAALHVRGSRASQADFAAQVEGYIRKAAAHEDELSQALALSYLDLEALAAAAADAAQLSEELGERPVLGYDEALAQELLQWFKRSFFSWVDRPPCDFCGGTATALQATTTPSDEEAAHLAGRTELYYCTSCPGVTRFPRYNDPAKLLETRRGRCGEWANCFALCCRAAGLDARLVADWTDHIWVEVFSGQLQRWVHLDPCEAAFDSPLLYEGGWGKHLTYCIAVGRDGVADVTRRYTRRWGQVQQRRRLDEVWLARYLAATNARLRSTLPAEARQALERRDAADEAAMAAAGEVPLTAAEEAELPARQTGSAEWVAARGEGGGGAAAPPAAPATGAAAAAAGDITRGIRYQRAADEGLRAQRPNRLCGGVVCASGENAPDERAARAADGDVATKWLAFGRGTAWLEYRLLPPAPAARVASYALTSANDAPERDPEHWVLECWDESRGAWAALDERRGVRFNGRRRRLEFEVSGGGGGVPGAAADAALCASNRFRLRVLSVADPRTANSVQLACWDLYAAV